MIKIYLEKRGILYPSSSYFVEKGKLPKEAVWIDLLSPTNEEIVMIEKDLNIDLPTPEEMKEIEISSRLYEKNKVYYMTITVVVKAMEEKPRHTVVTFIVKENVLITLRYEEPKAFEAFSQKVTSDQNGTFTSSFSLVGGLIEAIIDRTADVLEKISLEIEKVSFDVFSQNGSPKPRTDLNQVLVRIGLQGDLSSKVRESLVTITRMLSFILTKKLREEKIDLDNETLEADVNALKDYSNFLSSKINFLLDASLGMLSIQQNGIIKIFSVAAVVFLPPTLIASIYGMNFQIMPELYFSLGYPLALFLMLLSGILPYWYFKRCGWL